jgi:hypothetical protein
MTSALDNLRACVGYSRCKCRLMFRWKLEVVTACHNQGGHFDLAEAIHNRPALEQLTVPKDERLGSELHAQPQDYLVGQQDGAEVVVVCSS